MARPSGCPPVCSECPKGSPENARRLKLSPKNLLTLQLYLESRACGGAAMTAAMRRDRTVLRNFAILDSLFRERDAMRLAERLAIQVVRFMPRR